jgi:hypothetical protein
MLRPSRSVFLLPLVSWDHFQQGKLPVRLLPHQSELLLQAQMSPKLSKTALGQIQPHGIVITVLVLDQTLTQQQVLHKDLKLVQLFLGMRDSKFIIMQLPQLHSKHLQRQTISPTLLLTPVSLLHCVPQL